MTKKPRNPSFNIGFIALLLVSSSGAAARIPVKTKFGHIFYPEAPISELRSVGRYRRTDRDVKMRAAAAEAFLRMKEAARRDGVAIIPISGFRPVAYQKELFLRAIKNHGSEKTAAKWVAPPGYSEHATGWALDLGDESFPVTDVEPTFDKTPAFQWLQNHALEFHFEVSFPKNNSQGVNYEPWHWRFVGNDESRRTFLSDAHY